MILNEGDKAPAIKAKDQDGKTVGLDEYKGRKVILYFYPKDNTPGCTAEACNLRDNYSELKARGYAILGVSPDSEASHQKFIGKHELPFRLISDADKKVINDYGVWGEKNMYGKKSMGLLRTTFVIDEEGVIEKIFRKVKTKDHTAQILAAMEK